MEFKGNPECDSTMSPNAGLSMDSNTVPSMGSKGVDIPPMAGCVAPKVLNDEFPLPVIVCIAKLEQNYIEEFVSYHLALGFVRIYLFDNEDIPTYAALLKPYVDAGLLVVIHLPGNNYYFNNEDNVRGYIPVQYLALHIFTEQIMPDPQITHVAHIDIDEFIVLKKHNNICEFINEYIKDDCAGIGMNWRFFGSSFNTDPITKPVTQRFTMCAKLGDKCIKTLFKKEEFLNFDTCHTIVPKTGKIKSTDGTIIVGPYNETAPIDVIQVNHYKCKTLAEFRYIRTRMSADISSIANTVKEDVDANFKKYDINEVEDLTAKGTRQRELAVPFGTHARMSL